MLAFHQHSLEVYPDYNIRVVLMHDSVDKELTKQALPQLIEFLSSKMVINLACYIKATRSTKGSISGLSQC